MKPEQFIREYGVEKAREALTLCCWMDGSFCTRLWHGCVQNNHECCVDVKDIKRLVESIDLVESWGGIDDVKLYDLSHCKDKPESAGYKLLQAIADYESIYGGGDA
ncbi:TPA: hypothetical protein U9I93_003939 [Acinetobacter baumannii]|nr:hypothetical protein [Acinetobacter baumannii]HEN9537572.1 hypothetical protein [Acinetobacter baumannii]